MYGRINARKEEFRLADLFGRTVLFTPNLIDRRSIPKGMRMYEIRANDIGMPDELAHSMTGPKYGTIITNRYFSLNNGYRRIKKNEFAVRPLKTCRLKEFMRMYPPKKKTRQLFGM